MWTFNLSTLLTELKSFFMGSLGFSGKIYHFLIFMCLWFILSVGTSYIWLNFAENQLNQLTCYTFSCHLQLMLPRGEVVLWKKPCLYWAYLIPRSVNTHFNTYSKGWRRGSNSCIAVGGATRLMMLLHQLWPYFEFEHGWPSRPKCKYASLRAAAIMT